MRRSIDLILVFLITVTVVFTAFFWNVDRVGEKQAKVSQLLGAGINLGNDLDVVGRKYSYKLHTPYDYESYWGNTPVSETLLCSIKDAGFTSIRIPVSWGEHQAADGSIDAAWMKRVKEVVDMAYNMGLTVVLNLHHEDWLYPDAAHEAEVKARFVSLWRQIATTFAGYGERLIFEAMNEPRAQGTDLEWSSGNEEMRGVINRLNKAFVETVDACGGNNPTRYLMLVPYCSYGTYDALSALEIPARDHIIVAFHAYLPYKYTSDTEGKYHFSESDGSITKQIRQLKAAVDDLFIARDIPIVITEFGCKKKADDAERTAYTNYYVSTFGDSAIPCMWWDNGNPDAYALFDRSTGGVLVPGVVSVLTSRE